MAVRYSFIQVGMNLALFIPKPLSSQNHFHPKTTFIPKPLSSKTTFIQNHFHPKPLSSKTSFIRGPKHGVSERQVTFYNAKQMLKKARQGKHGNHPTILSRWYEQEGYRKSLTEHNIGEKEVMFFDRIVLEKDDFAATKAERLQNAKHWILRFNADGLQKPLRQRP